MLAPSACSLPWAATEKRTIMAKNQTSDDSGDELADGVGQKTLNASCSTNRYSVDTRSCA